MEVLRPRLTSPTSLKLKTVQVLSPTCCLSCSQVRMKLTLMNAMIETQKLPLPSLQHPLDPDPDVHMGWTRHRFHQSSYCGTLGDFYKLSFYDKVLSSDCPKEDLKVWVMPLGCGVKAFPREVSKDTQSVP